MRIMRLAAVLGALALAAACSSFASDPACAPVDPGGECFGPADAAFAAHALASAAAWPQLEGLALTAGPVIAAFDEAAGQPTWVVPLMANDRVVAASRFLPVGERVRLAEVALYQPPRTDFPVPVAGQRLVLIPTASCADPLPVSCLFANHSWRIDG
jgi:hypothetical protein